MADLLECLVQIRALGETERQLAALIGDVSRRSQPPDSVARPPVVLALVDDLVCAEHEFSSRLRAILEGHTDSLPAEERRSRRPGADASVALVDEAIARFRRIREENLALLGRCSAADLSRTGLHPQRGEVSVADLVALALAHDTDTIGWVREHLADTARGPTEGDS